jgi:predicted RNase H-like nuclease (RuvC/YqgF family)
MSEEGQETETRQTETETESESTTTEERTEAVLDAEAVERSESVEELRETVEQQQAQIEELEGLLLDLSTRVADGNSMGVCPDCKGAVIKVNPWFRSAKIKCTDCQRVFHEY